MFYPGEENQAHVDPYEQKRSQHLKGSLYSPLFSTGTQHRVLDFPTREEYLQIRVSPVEDHEDGHRKESKQGGAKEMC